MIINNVAHPMRNVFIEILETGFCAHAALAAGRGIGAPPTVVAGEPVEG